MKTRPPSIHAEAEIGIKEDYLLLVLKAFDDYFKFLDSQINNINGIKEINTL